MRGLCCCTRRRRAPAPAGLAGRALHPDSESEDEGTKCEAVKIGWRNREGGTVLLAARDCRDRACTMATPLLVPDTLVSDVDNLERGMGTRLALSAPIEQRGMDD